MLRAGASLKSLTARSLEHAAIQNTNPSFTGFVLLIGASRTAWVAPYKRAARTFTIAVEGALMCGRYVRRSDKQKIAEWFHAEPHPAELPMPDSDYNVAPTTHQPIIRQSKDTNEREMVLAR